MYGLYYILDIWNVIGFMMWLLYDCLIDWDKDFSYCVLWGIYRLGFLRIKVVIRWGYYFFNDGKKNDFYLFLVFILFLVCNKCLINVCGKKCIYYILIFVFVGLL